MVELIKIQDTERNQRPYNIKYIGYSSPEIKEFELKSQNFIKSDIYIINPVGFTSTPDTNDIAYVFLENSGEKFCIATDNYYKPDTNPNEVAIGNFKTNNYIRINDNEIKIEENGTEQIYIKANNKTSINSQNTIELISENNIIIKSPNITIEGDISIKGNLTINGKMDITGMITTPLGMTVNGKVINDIHTHIGVTGGKDNTGGVS